MHRPSRYDVPCWVVGMIDRPDENDLVALFRSTRLPPLSFRITPTIDINYGF